MKAIIENKIYDTEKCEKIYKYIKKVKDVTRLGIPSYISRHATIFKSKKGTYLEYLGKPVESCFLTIFDDYEAKLTKISEKEVKKILLNFNEVDIYTKLFGELEEG